MIMLMDTWNLLVERKDFFLQLLLEHLEICLTAILIAIVAGGLMGLFISEYQKSAKPTLGVINFLYTIPSISMLGFLIPFSGVGNTTAIIALTIYALLPMVRNTHTGITNVDPAILEAAKGMGSTPSQILFRIKLPLAMPVIMSGIRSMVTMTIALGGIASFIGAGGLGVAIYRGITTNNPAMTMAGSLLIALLALFMDYVLGLIEKRMNHRSRKKTRTNRMVTGGVLALCIVLICSFLFGSPKKDTLHVATKPMTEQYIMGEMLDVLIEQDTDLNVELTQGVGGGTSNIQPAMETGEFDLYPEYTGTGWNMVLKHDGIYSEDLFDELNSEYEEQYDMTWLGMYGFNNTYGIVVTPETAEKYNLKTCSDLQKAAPELTFGAQYDFFEREDGYKALCDTYDLAFGNTIDLNNGLKYQAIADKQIDCMVVFTTDGQLAASDLVVLEDDKHCYPSYVCGNVIRKEVLEKHPELKDILGKLDGLISDQDMAAMNYAVETEKKEPRDVAKNFLKEHNLVTEADHDESN